MVDTMDLIFIYKCNTFLKVINNKKTDILRSDITISIHYFETHFR